MLFRRIDTSTVLPVPRAEPLAPVETGQQALRRSLSALLGRQVQADVLSRLADGSFLVRVAGTPLRMALPPGAAPGSRLAMTLASLDPRPTFDLPAAGLAVSAEPWSGHEGQPAAGPSARSAASAYAAATLAARAQDILADATPPAAATRQEPAHGADLPTLSAGARILASVLGAAQAQPRQGVAVIAPAPLLAQPLPAPAQLAQHLQQAIAHSGLFYESHLAEWAAGGRTLQELAREPQASRPAATPPTDPDSARMVDLQLATHEHARVAWQGQPWPGLPMQWEIRREQAHARDGAGEGGAAGEEDGAAWRSDVRFTFAGLGEVAATIVLAGGRAHLRIDAADGEACERLRSHAHRLEAALGAAGVPLASLGVVHGGDPADGSDGPGDG